jgi:putative SOS response-associated peptidase YedK
MAAGGESVDQEDTRRAASDARAGDEPAAGWRGEAYRSRRCIVPMNICCQRDKHGKRCAIAMKDDALFGFAGIWEIWRNPQTDAWERTFAIVTIEAHALIGPIHDRMLVILRREDYPRWLGTEPDPARFAAPICR